VSLLHNNFWICIIFLFNLLLRDNDLSAAGAKEIAQNYKHLEGLKEFHLILQ
jgi:hypothetical protein